MLVLIHSLVGGWRLVALTHRASVLLGASMLLSPADFPFSGSPSLFLARLMPPLSVLRIRDWSST
jgi:hypothetical protein